MAAMGRWLALAMTAAAVTGGAVPNWPPTWDMAQSTIMQPCNDSGWFDPAFSGKFGLVSYDWSNAKQQWANQKPMDCEERLGEQAALTRAASPSTKLFVYRNLVKALPWFSSVREKISDPRYSGWFLHFKPGGSLPNGSYYVPPCTYGVCSDLYHDQDQTPEHPNGDGDCVDVCDCGGVVPCGEYLFDHRNASLRSWLIDEFILGSNGLGNANISGFFLDDNWHNTTQPRQGWQPPEGFCDHSAIGGPSEEDFHCVDDMGLTQEDTTALTDGWQQTIDAVHAAIIAAGGFSWDQFRTTSTPTQAKCAETLRESCQPNNTQDTSALQWSFTAWPNGTRHPLPQFEVDLAAFLLARGPYAWLGYGWIGCCTGDEPPGGGGSAYSYPAELAYDYGVPQGQCQETQVGSGVFTREWSKASVALDCNTYTPKVVVHGH